MASDQGGVHGGPASTRSRSGDTTEYDEVNPQSARARVERQCPPAWALHTGDVEPTVTGRNR
jgi:hypothetical protein